MESDRTKKTPQQCGVFNMARQEGFEPPTAWFVARYSIQLSYERTFDGGEGGIRTLDTGQTVYSLSRGAPSATRPPLQILSYVPTMA